MPYVEKEIKKLYWTMKEVTGNVGISASCLRYWEKEFEIKFHRDFRGERRLTSENVADLAMIHHLIRGLGFTIQGAKRQFKQIKLTSKQNGKGQERRIEEIKGAEG